MVSRRFRNAITANILSRRGRGARGGALIHAALRLFHYRLHFIKRTSLDTGNDHRESEGERRERDLNRFTVNRFSLVDCIADNRGEKSRKTKKRGRSGGRKKDGELKQSHFQDLNIETRHRLCSPLFSPLCVQPAYTLFLSLPVELSNDETGEWKEREK